nr:immunoglobulin heavy chain junction region [Macaca mulatta]MOX05294.1 immunoglobulin heavy chain junction region [Macaca mulatta]MOX05871.1 immunoglobulin heavy chain junction region [Macaca mulatta]
CARGQIGKIGGQPDDHW